MSHHYSPQIQSEPSVKDIEMVCHRSRSGFGPIFSLSSSGSFWPEQNAAILDKNIESSVDNSAWRHKEAGPLDVDTYSTNPHRDEIPTSSTSRISHPVASTFQGLKHSDVRSSSKEWSLMSRRDTNDDTSRCFSSSGFGDNGRFSCSEQIEDVPFIPGLSENSVSKQSALPSETSPPRYTANSAADILMTFGLVKEDLLELNSYSKEEITPENLPLMLHQISIKKQKRAAGISSELHRSTSMSSKTSLESNQMVTNQNKMPKSILKQRKVIDFGISDITCKDEIEKMNEDRGERGDALLSDNQRPSSCSQEALNADGEENRVQHRENQQKREHQGPVFKGLLPSSSMINDCTLSTPRVFPHTCSLCNKECVHMEDWLSHQNTSFHRENHRLLQKQFPEWDGEDQLSLSGKTKTSPSTSQTLQHRDQKTRHDSHYRSLNSRSSEDKRDKSTSSFGSSNLHHQSSNSHPYDRGSFRCSKGQGQKSSSRSHSYSPGHRGGSKDSKDRSVSPHRDTQSLVSRKCVHKTIAHSEQGDDVKFIPGLWEDPVTNQSALPLEFSPPTFTAESAEKLLLSFGLVKEDLVDLASYAENEITPDNLPHFLRQIRIQKQKRDGGAGNDPKTCSNKSVGLENDLNLNKNPGKKKKKKSKTKNKKTTYILGGRNLVYCRFSGVPVGGKIEKTSKPFGCKGDMLPLDNKKNSSCRKKPTIKNLIQVKPNDSDSVTNLSSKKSPLKKTEPGHMLTSETKKSCTDRPNFPASKNSNLEQSNAQEKRIIVGKEMGNQQTRRVQRKTTEMTPKHGKLQQTQPGFKIEKDLQHQFSSTNRAPFGPCPTFNDVDHMPFSPSDVYVDKEMISRCLPPLCQMNDYAAVTPKVFPCTCSICNKECIYNVQDWFSHQMSSFHLERCKVLRQQYPLWDGQVRILTSSRSRSRSRSRSSSRSRSRSRSPSPHSFRDIRRSPSRSWSPCYRQPTSRSNERRSPFNRREDEWSPLRRRSFEQNISPIHSHKRQMLPWLSHKRPFSTNKFFPQRRSSSTETLTKKLFDTSAVQSLSCPTSDLEKLVETLTPVILAEIDKMRSTPSTSHDGVLMAVKNKPDPHKSKKTPDSAKVQAGRASRPHSQSTSACFF
uniref:C2H2-type domain-containing protein n=1 Tax=Iconisemion striatum TaxID=60296 RepID=A0A1A7XDI8_9TELE